MKMIFFSDLKICKDFILAWKKVPVFTWVLFPDPSFLPTQLHCSAEVHEESMLLMHSVLESSPAFGLSH